VTAVTTAARRRVSYVTFGSADDWTRIEERLGGLFTTIAAAGRAVAVVTVFTVGEKQTARRLVGPARPGDMSIRQWKV
jgi:hypothetical protein